MSTKAAHTDLPWSYTELDPHIYNIPTFEISGGNKIYWVAQVRNVDSAPHGSEALKCKANVDLIITAVNNHQELITRLYNLTNQAQLALDANINHAGLVLAVKEARETLKKVIQ